MDLLVPYQPHAKQRLFHASPAEEVVYGGAKGGGKSCALTLEACAYACEHAGALVYLFRETYDALEASLIEEWRQKVPRALYAFNQVKRVASLANGSRVYFRYIASEADAYRYAGRSMDFIGVDELTRHSERAIQVLLSCLRSAAGFPPRFRGTCNPGGIGHHWVRARYIEPTGYGQKIAVDPVTGNRVAFIPARVYDNDAIMQNDPAYVRRLENLPEDERRAYLHGDWDIFAGQVFREFRRAIHAVAPFAIPDGWLKFRAMDWGYARPFSIGWYAVDSDGRLYRYREWYGWTGRPDEGCRLDAAAVAARVAELERHERVSFGVLDPSAFARAGHTGPSIAEEFLRRGVMFHPADNDRLSGKMQVHARLRLTSGRPGLVVFDTCAQFLRTIPALTYDPKRVEDVDSAGEDHVYDELRYACLARPMPPPAPAGVAKPLPWELKSEERRGSGYLEW